MAEEQKANNEERKDKDIIKKAIIDEAKDNTNAKPKDLDEKVEAGTAASEKPNTSEPVSDKQDDELVTDAIDVIQDAAEANGGKDQAQEKPETDQKEAKNASKEEQTETENQKKKADEVTNTSEKSSEEKNTKSTNNESKTTENEVNSAQNRINSAENQKNLVQNEAPANRPKSGGNMVRPGENDTKAGKSESASAEDKSTNSAENGEEPTENDQNSVEKQDNSAEKSAQKGIKTTPKPAETDYNDEDFAEDEEDEEPTNRDNVDDALTEDSEDESTSERHNIPKKEYDRLGKEALIKEFRYLLNKYKVQAIKEHIDEIRAAFIAQFEEEQEEAKEKFLEEGGNIIDFRYYSPLKKEFNTLYFEYRDKRNKYFQNLKKDLNANLETRNALIEELKELKNEVGGEDSINTTFDKFKDIQDRWRNAGNIPRDRYNLVWNNYHHHVENFYDFLHLNREFRDKDFKENLDKKLKLVEQAEELAKAEDPLRAFKELQMLHKMWKEEIGPVAKEYREEIWEKFSAATKKIHESRQEYFQNIDKKQEENLVKKQAVIDHIEEIAANPADSHKTWQKQMKNVEALRKEFFKIGRVPRKENDKTWKAFKKATRNFNRNKNGFYKNQKKEQYENLDKKMELVKIAEDNKDNEDMETTIELMKKIQADWKKIGHVPRKDSDKIWKRFKSACNHAFDRLHAEKKEALAEEKGNLEEKQQLLKKVKEVQLSGDRQEDLKTIKDFIKQWKDTGRVPFSQKSIEKDFNKVLDGLFKKLDMGRKETEMIKYDNRIAAMADRDDERQIDKERYFISKKIDEVKGEINQLENNLGFFQHVPDDNPMVKEVHKNINNQKKDLEIWKAKLKKIKTLY